MTTTETTTRAPLSPLRLLGLLLVAAILGGGIVVALQTWVPGLGGRARTEAVVHDYVLAHPEILPEAMDRLQSRETAQAVQANKASIVQPFGSAWQGAKNPDVTVAVYMDYDCTFCRASLPEIEKLVQQDPKVRVVYHDLPILSAESQVAARWSLAAAKQGKFQNFHDTLFHEGQLTQATIETAAKTAGLNMDAARAYADSDQAKQQIAQDYDIARSLQMSGTPTWVIGDQVVSGAMAYDQLQKLIDQARPA